MEGSSSAESALHKVSISGAILASMMDHLVSGSCDSDGILFGSVLKRSVVTLTDDDSSNVSKEECVATITGYYLSDTIFSFYDAVGTLDSTKLSQLTKTNTTDKNGTAIGWFVVRRNVPLLPSMREKLVTAQLQRLPKPWCSPTISSTAIPTIPTIFCLFGAFSDSSSSIHTYDYRAFHASQHSLNPVSIVVSNIGPAFRANYDSFTPSSNLASIDFSVADFSTNSKLDECKPSSERGSNNQSSQPEGTDYLISQSDSSIEDLVSHSIPQVKKMEEMYGTMLGRLENLVLQVANSSLEIQNQKKSNFRLQKYLDSTLKL